MSGMYRCPECGRELRCKGLCWSCKAEQERREILESHLEQFLADEPQTANAAAQTDLTGGEMPLPDASETKEPLTLYTGLPEEP